LSRAVDALKKGELVVYPTDNLYALGADVFNESAVKKVFTVKNRPFDMPLSVAVSGVEAINRIAFVDDRVKILVDGFLPGCLSLVLKKRDVLPGVVTGGLDKVAVRIPDNVFALSLLDVFGPLTVTSANVHGEKTMDSVKDVEKQLKSELVSLYVDSGVLSSRPSTIVDITLEEPVILRKGEISLQEILKVLK